MKLRFPDPDQDGGEGENPRRSSNYSTVHCPSDGLLLAGKQNLVLPLVEIPAEVAGAAQQTGSGGEISLQQ